jgi:penicillin-binding protein 1A
LKDKKGANDGEDKGNDDLANKPETDKQKIEEAKKKAEQEKKKKEEEAKKKAEQEKNKQNENPDCNKKITHTNVEGEGYGSLFDKYKAKCNDISEEFLKTENKNEILKHPGTVTFTCKCKQ